MALGARRLEPVFRRHPVYICRRPMQDDKYVLKCECLCSSGCNSRPWSLGAFETEELPRGRRGRSEWREVEVREGADAADGARREGLRWFDEVVEGGAVVSVAVVVPRLRWEILLNRIDRQGSEEELQVTVDP